MVINFAEEYVFHVQMVRVYNSRDTRKCAKFLW